nr:MAG TPA: hypothetical protein [Caudoviricetes sp.]
MEVATSSLAVPVPLSLAPPRYVVALRSSGALCGLFYIKVLVCLSFVRTLVRRVL